MSVAGPSPSHRTDWRALGWIVALGTMLRLAYLLAQPSSDPSWGRPGLDGGYYLEWAKRIAAGEVGIEGAYYLAPLYAWLLAGLTGLFGGVPWLGLFAMQHLAVVAMAAWVGRELTLRHGRVAGATAAAALLFSRGLLYYGSRPAGETLTLALAVLGWTLLERFGGRGVVAAGLLMGLATLGRPNFLLIPAAWAVWLIVSGRRGRALWLIAGFAVVLAPVATRNLQASGHLVPVSSNAGITLYHGNGPGASGVFVRPSGFSGAVERQRDEATALARQRSGRTLDPVEADRWWGRRAVDARLSDIPGSLGLGLKRMAMTLSRHEFALESHPELDRNPFRATFRVASELAWLPLGIVAALTALGWVWRGAAGAGGVPFWLALVACAAVPVLFYVASRYRLPLEAFLAIGAGFGAQAWVDFRQGRLDLPPWRRWVGALVVAAVLALSFGFPVDTIRQSQRAAAYSGLAATLDRQGRLVEAEQAARQGLALQADDPILHFNLARILERRGDIPAARRSYAEALRVDPGQLDAAANLAGLSIREGRPAEAIEPLRRALSAQPAHRGAWTNLVVALTLAGRREEALAAIDAAAGHAVAIDPELIQQVRAMKTDADLED